MAFPSASGSTATFLCLEGFHPDNARDELARRVQEICSRITPSKHGFEIDRVREVASPLQQIRDKILTNADLHGMGL